MKIKILLAAALFINIGANEKGINWSNIFYNSANFVKKAVLSPKQTLNELKNGKTVTSFQNRHQMKSGNYKWFSWTANRSDADGNIYAVGLDCTDKMMRANEKLTPEKVAEKTMDNNAKEWVGVARELRDNINRLLQKSPLYFNAGERENENSYSLLLHSSISALNAIGEIKKLSETLISRLNKEPHLTDNVKELIEDTMSIHPVKIKFDSQNFSEEVFNTTLKLNIFSIVQQQLNYILKHAQATLVQINLEQISDKLFLSIQDNGVGFNKVKQKKQLGISNIISCAEKYNGEVFIDTAPGKGCTLSVTFIEPALN